MAAAMELPMAGMDAHSVYEASEEDCAPGTAPNRAPRGRGRSRRSLDLPRCPIRDSRVYPEAACDPLVRGEGEDAGPKPLAQRGRALSASRGERCALLDGRLSEVRDIIAAERKERTPSKSRTFRMFRSSSNTSSSGSSCSGSGTFSTSSVESDIITRSSSSSSSNNSSGSSNSKGSITRVSSRMLPQGSDDKSISKVADPHLDIFDSFACASLVAACPYSLVLPEDEGAGLWDADDIFLPAAEDEEAGTANRGQGAASRPVTGSRPLRASSRGRLRRRGHSRTRSQEQLEHPKESSNASAWASAGAAATGRKPVGKTKSRDEVEAGLSSGGPQAVVHGSNMEIEAAQRQPRGQKEQREEAEWVARTSPLESSDVRQRKASDNEEGRASRRVQRSASTTAVHAQEEERQKAHHIVEASGGQASLERASSDITHACASSSGEQGGGEAQQHAPKKVVHVSIGGEEDLLRFAIFNSLRLSQAVHF